ncbi:MFS transporter [Roseiflexus castenholzii]|uniref:Major facilitator superfamily MFS_1 n=1 Tax=Roseiflexus castenholzii (strain DSM 13941 / HLO8) TaxID=383372 RepID=A7NHB8_ROSCS|nr:MFS transporter [Roseiflexus castenholzii]ABU56865.1 major facilitator superfamily MFS_1 [Roseiflexus castenholzii DSM 13941]
MTDAQISVTLSPVQRRHGAMVMLVITFLMWGGFFMVIPLLSLRYVDDLGWSAGAVGLVLAIRQLTQQGLTVFGGALADRFGAKELIVVGMLIRAISFSAMAVATTYPFLMISAILAALGGALFDSPSSAAMVALTRPEERNRYFAVLGIVRGLGMSLGPLVGAALLRVDFAFVALAAGGCFFVASGITFLLLPPVRVAAERSELLAGILMALRDRRFMAFNVLLMGYWFMWVQLTISLPLAARALAGTSDAVSWLYALNAGMSVLLQYPVVRLAERWLRPLPVLMFGIVLMALGLGSVVFAGAIGALLVSVALFSFGALLAAPGQQTVAADLANPAALGSYFGVSALALALGGGIGNYAGGALYSLGHDINFPALPWLVCLGVGIGSAAGLAALDRRLVRRAESGVRG